MHENTMETTKAVLVSIDTGEFDVQRSVDELEELAKSAGAVVKGRVIQRKERPDPATLMGAGRLEEVAEFVRANEIDLVIFDHELAPAQQKNLENALDVAVIDRTTLILDIFAQRAKTSEGRLQVELAQLKYRLPRLSGLGTSLSRLGGGIGTRGPGESKLESDRRHIRRRIHSLEEELKELENKILGAHERLIALEHRLFNELLESIGAQLDRIQRTANAVAELDVLAALAQVAAENNYCRPTVDESDQLTIVEGRHPVVEQMLKGSLFVPNDTTLNCGEDRCLIITGPNMAGKSTYMRQNALIALMAQIGSFVPARECHVGVVDAIFTRIGASDDLSAGQSTFMVEMTEVAEILKNATSRSLVVLDEIGRGTSTFDGMSIARAVVEHISDPAKGLGCKTLFATHYHELTDLEGTISGVKNYNIAVKKRGEDITFLRRIVRGPADDSYGIEVAKLAGLPGTVTRRAHEVLRALEATAPKNKVEQMDFDALQEYNSPAVPSEVLEKLDALDVETLTPIEALNFLYELKKTLKGSLNG